MLSNYLIEKQLGKGTYGVVYKVKKRDDNKIYVLKQISLIGLTSSQKDEVKLEAQVLSKIKSKYVVKYYDSFEEDGKLNIIMEYCDNGDLNDFIERQKLTKHLLSENLVWKIFIKITLGLADIHKLKILHRDLKSLNIFLKKDEDIRVGDLGVAKILNQTFFATSLSETRPLLTGINFKLSESGEIILTCKKSSINSIPKPPGRNNKILFGSLTSITVDSIPIFTLPESRIKSIFPAMSL